MSDREKVGIVGLGYVGLPVALGFAEKYDVIGYDIDEDKMKSLNNHRDPTGQFSKKTVEKASVRFVSDPHELRNCSYIIVTVPTPITETKEPDLSFLKEASCMIGKHLSPNTIVIFESTVYPGTTENICMPILEDHSNMAAGVDFHVGYSPERINPGDSKHTFHTNAKIVSGQNAYALEKIYEIYQSVINAEVYKAPSMKVAEAAKIVENTQRDVNIALMNEFSLIFDKLDIDTYEVLDAAKTKWNFIPMSPGLVGGHCIGVDPYYLIYKSKLEGYSPKFLTAAREINDSIPDYIFQSLLHLIVSHKLDFNHVRITVLGTTFKENISDIRNSKSLEIIDKINQLELPLQVCDPHTSHQHLKNRKNMEVKPLHQLKKADIIILAVPHKEFQQDNFRYLHTLFTMNKGILMDIKGIVPKQAVPKHVHIWRL